MGRQCEERRENAIEQIATSPKAFDAICILADSKMPEVEVEVRADCSTGVANPLRQWDKQIPVAVPAVIMVARLREQDRVSSPEQERKKNNSCKKSN